MKSEVKTQEVKKEVKAEVKKAAEVLEVEVVKEVEVVLEVEVVKEKSDEDKAGLTRAKAFKSDPKSRASSTKSQMRRGEVRRCKLTSG